MKAALQEDQGTPPPTAGAYRRSKEQEAVFSTYKGQFSKSKTLHGVRSALDLESR